MKWFASLSVYSKIIYIILSMLILLSLLLGIVMWNSLDTLMGQQLEKRGIEVTNRVASLCADHILVNNPYALFEIINQVQSSSEDIRYVIITDYKGRLLAHTFSEGIPKGLLEITSAAKYTNTGNNENIKQHIEYLMTNEGMIRDILIPIEDGNVGFARVGISEKYIKALIRQKLRDIILITLLVCAAASFLASRITALITRPVSELVRATREIAGGNLESRIEVKSSDEIGQLAGAFNHMSESLITSNSEKNRLLETLREKEHLRAILLNKLITAQEDERKRISRELHDETSQGLTSLIVSMRLLADKETDLTRQGVIMDIRDHAASILENVRNLAVELRPPVLDDLGLTAAMIKYIARYQDNFGLTVDFKSTISDKNLDNQVALALYRIMQEGLTNIVKHAGARNVKIRINQRGKGIVLKISDDGRGVNQEALEKAVRENRIGIYGMKERAELFGGTFNLKSSATGTEITITIPGRWEDIHDE